MKARLARLGLAAGMALVAAAPLTQASHAFYCEPPVVSTVCSVYGAACRAIPDSDKYRVHDLACESFA